MSLHSDHAGPCPMLKAAIIRIVDASARHPWWVVVLALALFASSAVYAERHFAIKTDITALISPHLAWAQRVRQFLQAFPEREILVVIDAPTPELAAEATDRLARALEANPVLFLSVRQPQGGTFCERNALLYQPIGEVRRTIEWLTQADSVIGMLSADPSLRG